MVCVWLLARRDRHPHGVWLVPVAVIPWANLHGSFPLVFVLLLFAWLEDRRRAPSLARIEVLAGLAALVASFANPFGVRVWSYVWDLSTHPVVSHQVAEWGPPSVHSWTGRFFFVTLLGVAAYLARRRPPVDWRTLLELAFFAVLGLLAIRGVVWWGLYWPVVIRRARAGARAAGFGGIARRSTRSSIACLVALTAVATTVHLGTDMVTRGPDVLSYAPTDRSTRPQRASLRDPTRSWTSCMHRGAVSGPRASGGCDPSYQIFPKETWDDYLLVSQGRDGWQEVLDRWDVRVLVLHPDQSTGLLSVIDDDPRWRPVLKTFDRPSTSGCTCVRDAPMVRVMGMGPVEHASVPGVTRTAAQVRSEVATPSRRRPRCSRSRLTTTPRAPGSRTTRPSTAAWVW